MTNKEKNVQVSDTTVDPKCTVACYKIFCDIKEQKLQHSI